MINPELTLTYEPLQSPKYSVQSLYIVCKNHDGCFQSPSIENTATDACTRLTLGMKLIQNLYCDKLMEQGFGRKTFQLNGECVPFYSQLPVDDAKTMDENSLWNYFAREVIATEVNALENKKFVAFIGCTEYRGIVDGNYSHENLKLKTVANAALGGGDFALFGTGCLYAWPKSVSETMKCFESTDPVDLEHFLDDSNSRRTFGGCFATTLGSVCHEVGHIFDLGHSRNGIMGSGFDFVDRVFTVCNRTQDLPHRSSEPVKEQLPTDPRLTKLKSTNKFLNLFHSQK
ncbi:putative zinc metalloproteinase, partial [Pseudolycoriella hygida]